MVFILGEVKSEGEKGSESAMTSQTIKSETPNTASPYSNNETSRGIKREGSFSQTQGRGQTDPKKSKPS